MRLLVDRFIYYNRILISARFSTILFLLSPLVLALHIVSVYYNLALPLLLLYGPLLYIIKKRQSLNLNSLKYFSLFLVFSALRFLIYLFYLITGYASPYLDIYFIAYVAFAVPSLIIYSSLINSVNLGKDISKKEMVISKMVNKSTYCLILSSILLVMCLVDKLFPELVFKPLVFKTSIIISIILFIFYCKYIFIKIKEININIESKEDFDDLNVNKDSIENTIDLTVILNNCISNCINDYNENLPNTVENHQVKVQGVCKFCSKSPLNKSVVSSDYINI